MQYKKYLFQQPGFMDPGPCPKAAPIATFDAEKFSGDWYMISFKPNMMESASLKCRQESTITIANIDTDIETQSSSNAACSEFAKRDILKIQSRINDVLRPLKSPWKSDN